MAYSLSGIGIAVALLALARQLGNFTDPVLAKTAMIAGGLVLVASVGSLSTILWRARKEDRTARGRGTAPASKLPLEIRYDYLPGSPLDNGWVKAYGDGKPEFTSDPRITDSLRMTVIDKFAMDYFLPAEAQ